MTTRRPLALYKGIVSEVLDGDYVRTGRSSASGVIAGSGLVGGGSISDTTRVDAALASNPSGLIFVGDSLGIDGVAEANANAGLASGNAAILVASSALASGNAALATSVEAQASGNAALFDASTVHFDLPGTQHIFEAATPVISGQPLGLDDLGKVQTIKYIPSAKNRFFTSSTTYQEGAISNLALAYASTPDRYVFVFRNSSNSGYGTVVVGEWNGTSWTFAAAQIYTSAAVLFNAVAYDSTNDAVVIAYDVTSGPSGTGGAAIVGAFSGTTLSFGTEVLFDAGDINFTSICYDSTNQKVVIAYEDDASSDHGKAVVGTVSGSSISFGAVATFEAAAVAYTAVVHDSTNNKIVIAYEDDANSDYGTAIVGTVSGTSISFGTAAVFDSTAINWVDITFDSSNGKVVVCYEGQTGDVGKVAVGTVSGTSISFGSPVTFDSGSVIHPHITYDSTHALVNVLYSYYTSQQYNPFSIVGAVSGTTVNFETEQEVISPGTFEAFYPTPVYNSSRDEVVVCYQDQIENNGKVFVSSVGASGALPTLNSQNNFVGIAQSTVASGSDCLVNLPGGLYNETAANLTLGSFYYLDPRSSGITTSTTEAISWSGQVPWNYIGKAVSSSGLMLLKSI